MEPFHLMVNSWKWRCCLLAFFDGSILLNGVLYFIFPTSFLRLAILRVHSHGLVTVDLQCYEEDDFAQVDNVGDSKHTCTTLFHFLKLQIIA